MIGTPEAQGTSRPRRSDGEVQKVEIPVLAADSVGAAGAEVKRVDYFVPVAGAGAEMLTGSTEEVAGKLVDLLKAKGGIK